MKINKIKNLAEETEGRSRILFGWQLKLAAFVSFIWSLFQLWYASPLPFIVCFGVFIDVPALAIHLGFGLFLAFLLFPFNKKNRSKKINILNFLLSIIAFFVTFYLFYNYEALVYRNGVLLKHPLSLFGNEYFFPTELVI